MLAGKYPREVFHDCAPARLGPRLGAFGPARLGLFATAWRLSITARRLLSPARRQDQDRRAGRRVHLRAARGDVFTLNSRTWRISTSSTTACW